MATPNAAVKAAIIICSVRPKRVGPSVAQHVQSLIDARPTTDSTTTEYKLVDLADFNLPVFNEPLPPAMVPAKGPYTHDHTKKWSAEIAKYAGYVFVTPEYNYGIPGATKNAVDFLFNEWAGKPALVVSYGIHGGTIASAALSRTLEGMKMRVVKVKPNLKFAGDHGPDMFAAMLEGRLGEETRREWEGEMKGRVLEAVGEFEGLLGEGLVPRKEGE